MSSHIKVAVHGGYNPKFMICMAAIRQARGTDRVTFAALGANLWAQCGPGDTAEPVITIMLEGED